MVANDRRRGRLRPLAGWVISGLLVVLLIGRVDIGQAADALLAASLPGLGIAVALVCLEVGLRARRWQLLLEASRPVAYPRTAAYLCVGYFANTLLPARLGDLARAHLAGRDFGIDRLTTLGTIVVERVLDASLILVTVIALGLMTPAARELVAPAVALIAIGGIAATAGLVAGLAMHRHHRRMPTIVRRGVALVCRVAEGATALRSPSRAAGVAMLTVSAFLVAIIEFWVIAGAVGLRLSPMEAAIVMGALALSTSIPAAPGSLGTYELVGVAVLTQLGTAPGPALAAVVLMHFMATLPPALVGLAAFGRFHLRVADLRAPSSAGAPVVA